MLKIRLRRMGARNAPFYRIVVSDSRRTPTASAVEEIGWYDPRRTPSAIELDRARFDYWVGRGALLSDTVAQIAAKAAKGAAASTPAPAAAASPAPAPTPASPPSAG
jgi:small subunit ribosomal protein S16